MTGGAGDAEAGSPARRSTEAERAELNALFAELCAIASPSGHEAAVRERVVAFLEGIGCACAIDDAGNVLTRVGVGDGRPSVLLCAHLDTVPHGDTPIVPVVVDEGWENENDAILGADNKAAIAVMMIAARRIAAAGAAHAGADVELLLTVEEEIALAGAKRFDVGRLDSVFGYVYDHATPIGEIVMASPTYYRLTAEFRGRAAHAGIRPEDGRSAIVAAARAIAAMRHGRLDEQTTANIGHIEGGRAGATNIVADKCTILAETRSLDAARAESVVAEMVDHCHDAANDPECECDLDVVVERLFEGYRHKPSSPAVQAAERALRATGYTPRQIVSGGAADGNAFEVNGFHTVCLANGTERNHEPTERVSVAALESMLDVTYALLEEIPR